MFSSSISLLLLAVLVVLQVWSSSSGWVPKIQVAPGGPYLSRIAFGTLHLTECGDSKGVLARLMACLQIGITTIDLADVYGGGRSNELMGEVLTLMPSLRPQLQLICKFGVRNMPSGEGYIDTSLEYVDDRINYYLNVLNTTYLDVAVFHGHDPLLDVEAVADKFLSLKQAGKVNYFAVSNFFPEQYRLFNAAMKKRGLSLVTHEIEISVLIPTALYDSRLWSLMEEGISPLAWGPLGGDPYGHGNRLLINTGPAQARILKTLHSLSPKYNVDVDTLAVAWLLKHPARIIPILGTMNVTRIVSQSAALNVTLEHADWWWIAGSSAMDDYKRWESIHGGQWHDIVNDRKNIFGSGLCQDVPPGFNDYC